MDMNRRSFLRGLFGGAAAAALPALAAPYVPAKAYSFLGGILRPREILIAEGWYRQTVVDQLGDMAYVSTPIKLFKRGDKVRYESDASISGTFDFRGCLYDGTTYGKLAARYVQGMEELLLSDVPSDPHRMTVPFRYEIPPLRERC